MATRKTVRRIAIALCLALGATALLAAPAGASVFGPRPGHSPNADEIRTAYWVAIIVGALLIVAVHIFLIAALVRFRARRGRSPRRFTAGARAFVRPAAPLVAVAVGLFVFGIVMTTKTREVQATGPEGLGANSDLVAQVSGLSAPAGSPVLNINVIGQRWLWRFEYPGGRPGDRVFSYGELTVPVDTTVLLHLTSTDVTHRWFIPTLGGQVDAIPGQDLGTWFRADETGIYHGQSTSFSGTSYATMRAWVRVVTPQEYQQFIASKRQQLTKAQDYVTKKLGETAPAGPMP
ncbi:MAG: cytochrome c oxidase subunit II [Solirubrobacterales bacterium]